MNFLNIPGLYNSGEAHWQTRWEKINPASFTRINQHDWEKPLKDDWVYQLNEKVRELEGPAILVAHSLGCNTASMNDPYCAIDRAAKWAAYWGSRFVSLGNKGHINSDSNLGDWEEGWSLLRELELMAAERQYKYAS